MPQKKRNHNDEHEASLERLGVRISIDTRSAAQLLAEVLLDGQVVLSLSRPRFAMIYTMLALQRTSQMPDALITAKEVHVLPPWRNSKPHNLVVNFAQRHIGQALFELRLGALIAYQEVTKAWRLQLANEQVEFVPNRDAVAQLFETRSCGESQISNLDNWSWVSRAVQCFLTTETDTSAQGVEIALTHITAAGQIDSQTPIRRLVAQYLLTRISSRKPLDELAAAVSRMESILTELNLSQAAIGQSLLLRTLGSMAFARRVNNDELPKIARELDQLILRATQIGDLSVLGALHNVLGIVLVRWRPLDPETRARAREAYQKAITYQIVGRDIVQLQAAVHNAMQFEAAPTLCWREPASDWLIELHSLAIACARPFGIGAQSALSPSLGIVLDSSRGDFARAESWANEADHFAKGFDNPNEHAFLAFAKAQMHWWRFTLENPTALVRRAAIEHMVKAQKLYLIADDQLWTGVVTRHLAALKAGRTLTKADVADIWPP